MTDKIAVLIPCFNEEATIGKVVSDFRRELPDAVVYVYDNNSTDGTVKAATDSGATVRHESRQGKGHVVRRMFREIDAECYLLVDGDDTYPTEAAKQMCREVLENSVDMVIGDRLSTTYAKENKRRFHNTGNFLVRKLINAFFKGNVKDVMTGYRAFSPLFVRSFPVLSTGFEIETEMTIHALDKDMSYVSVPVSYRDRPKGSESKLRTFKDGFGVLFTIFKLFKDYRPMPFFTIIAAICTAFSACYIIPILLVYLRTNEATRVPTLITSGFILVAALLFFSCGLILDTVVKKARMDFEVKLNIIQMLLKKQGCDDE